MTGGMGTYASLLRPLLFRLDAELAHNLALWSVARGLIRCRLVRDPRLHVSAMGLDFCNPIGLAAGLDKNAVAITRWETLGFGFAEVGTLTPLAQPGNPKPRLFRIPAERAIINRMGFNNDGIDAAAERLKHAHAAIPIGINLGANKSTPTEEAWRDYETAFAKCHELGDYFVVNVSSPNTPGLRSLQNQDDLRRILAAMKAVDASRPLLVKIAPDLEKQEVVAIVESAMDLGCAGIIATNTTVARPGACAGIDQSGGLSGAPLFEISNDTLATVASVAGGSACVIGVGGISGAKDVLTKLRMGASLVQMYTGWVYGGPTLVPQILTDLICAMEAVGAGSLQELIASP